MPVVFEDCRLRIERAYANHVALAEAWNEIPAEDLYRVGAKVNPDGTGTITLTRPRPVSTIFSLQIGEILYQLRAALDGAVYQAAIIDSGQDPPPNETNLAFPIFPKPRDYLKKAALKVAPLSKKRRDLIESMQLYNAPKLPPEQWVFNGHRNLTFLNDWARHDRHRRLHVLGAWASKASPKITCPPGVKVSSLKVVSTGFLKDQNILATFRLTGWAPGVEVKANPYLAIEIAIDESPPPVASNDTFSNRLAGIQYAVGHAVAKIENSFG